MSRITAHGLYRTYRSRAQPEVHALQGVDLTVSEPGLTAIVGRSGSGKTTLLQCLSGLDRPDRGTVDILGTNLTEASDAAVSRLYRDRIGFVFQQFSLVDSLGALDNAILPQRLGRSRIDRARARSWFDRLGLAGREKHLPAQLSGGEQQRVALIRALLKHPDIIFADEPTGALDSENGDLVLRILSEHAATGATVVLVTHDVTAASMAERVIVLRDGRIVENLERPHADVILAALSSPNRDAA